jgi:hypothetical protein
MPNDALDPGDDGSYPYWPRTPEGEWDAERMPTGLHFQPGPNGESVLVDMTPRPPWGLIASSRRGQRPAL